MSIDIIDSFNINSNKPIDSRMIVADTSERNLLNSNFRYDGMFVYLSGSSTWYQLKGGTDNTDWQELILDGSGSFSGSFEGNGSQLTNILTSSITNFDSEVSRSIAESGFGNGVSDYTNLTNVPGGIVSSSTQITNLGFTTNSGSFSGSFQGDGSQLTNILTSSITNFALHVSASAASFGFISSGSEASGEANTMSNIGDGFGVFSEKNLVDFRMKTLTGSNSILVTTSSTELDFEVRFQDNGSLPAGINGKMARSGSEMFVFM